MKSRDSLIRLKRFHADEKRRQVAQMETMIAEFERMARELDEPEIPEERGLNPGLNPADGQPKLNPPDHPAETIKAIQAAAALPPEVKSGAPEFLEFDGLVRKSSRPLFPQQARSKYSLSILQ